MARFILRSHLRPWGRRWTFTLVAGNGEPVLLPEDPDDLEPLPVIPGFEGP